MGNKVYKIISILLGILWIYLYISGYSRSNGCTIFIGLAFTNILLIYRCFERKNIILILVFSYMLPYTLIQYYEYFSNIQLSFHQDFNIHSCFYGASLIHLLFFIVLNYFIKIPKFSLDISAPLDNKRLFYGTFFIAILAFLLGKTGDIKLLQGGYGANMHTNILYEYFFVPFILSFYSSGLRKERLKLIYILAFLYIAKNTLYGGRIETLQMGICLLILRFQILLKFKHIIVLLFLGYLFFSMVGFVRAHGLSSIESFAFNVNKGIIINQEADVVYSSARFWGMTEKRIIDNNERKNSFLLFILSIITSVSSLPEIANLSSYMQREYSSGGGALISAYFYVFLSYIGVFLIGYYIAKIFSIKYSGKLHFPQIYYVLALTTVPRWFAYTPLTLFKMVLWGTILIWFSVYFVKKQQKLHIVL